MQEGTRKDVERCFGVLQAHFAIFKIQVDNGTWPQSKVFS
jgi:hypothetical protein